MSGKRVLCFSGTGSRLFNGLVGIFMAKGCLEEEEAAWIVGVGMGQHRENPGFSWTS